DRWTGFRLPNLLLPFNLTGQPAISVAAGLGAGALPVAIQLAGRPGEDALVLRAAHAYEIARGPLPLPPLLAG
ncbi:MAG: amidase family protein, partial [Elioraea sp.]|nr:amidase family protein [Elioraea sp.]